MRMSRTSSRQRLIPMQMSRASPETSSRNEIGSAEKSSVSRAALGKLARQ
jgi:hypothetical protein